MAAPGGAGLHCRKEESIMPTHMQQYKAGPLTFIVRHELWDGNVHSSDCDQPADET